VLLLERAGMHCRLCCPIPPAWAAARLGLLLLTIETQGMISFRCAY
jgi:hypothetical protein